MNTPSHLNVCSVHLQVMTGSKLLLCFEEDQHAAAFTYYVIDISGVKNELI